MRRAAPKKDVYSQFFYCPDGSLYDAMKEACDMTSFGFEDFALDIAEELDSTASAYGLRGSTIEEE